MQFEGTIKAIGAEELVGKDSLPKVTIVLEELGDSKYPNTLAVEFFKDKISLLDGVNVGDILDCDINTRCNESKTQPGRYFNSISCWKLNKKNADYSKVEGEI
jgi:hypothetical protein